MSVLELYAKQINNLIYYFEIIKITSNDKYVWEGAEKVLSRVKKDLKHKENVMFGYLVQFLEVFNSKTFWHLLEQIEQL